MPRDRLETETFETETTKLAQGTSHFSETEPPQMSPFGQPPLCIG